MDDIFNSDRDTTDSEITAHQRLRAFEDQHLGEDAVRINGEVERGHGSRFKTLSPEHHREYAALERLRDAEKVLSDAAGKLAQAQSAHAEAQANADAAAVDDPEPDPAPEPEKFREQPTQES